MKQERFDAVPSSNETSMKRNRQLSPPGCEASEALIHGSPFRAKIGRIYGNLQISVDVYFKQTIARKITGSHLKLNVNKPAWVGFTVIETNEPQNRVK